MLGSNVFPQAVAKASIAAPNRTCCSGRWEGRPSGISGTGWFVSPAAFARRCRNQEKKLPNGDADLVFDWGVHRHARRYTDRSLTKRLRIAQAGTQRLEIRIGRDSLLAICRAAT
jgi:hypothetical protein